jgi:hypothetical protein
MKTDGWYYSVDGGEVHGPLPMETIRAAVSAGRLPEDAAVSHHATGPWAPLSVVSKLGDEAFGAGGKKRAASAKKSAMSAPRSVAGLIEVIGFVIIAIGLACIVGVFVAFQNDSPRVYPLIVMAISNLFCLRNANSSPTSVRDLSLCIFQTCDTSASPSSIILAADCRQRRQVTSRMN